MTDNIATAAIAIPYNPANRKAAKLAKTRTITGQAVDCMPTANPLMMLVALPVTEASAMLCTGLKRVPV